MEHVTDSAQPSAPQPDEAERASARDSATDATPEADVVTRDEVPVQVRMTPRYGRFMALGALVGLLAGWLIAQLGGSGPWLGTGQWTDTTLVVPFVMLIGAIVGIVLGAVVAIVLDRIVGRRTRQATAERTRHR